MNPKTEVLATPSPDDRPDRGVVKRDQFAGDETHALSETATTAAAEQARALIESQYVMAVKRPRNMMTVRTKILAECARPRFAEAAQYKLERTKWNPETKEREKVEIRGHSIKFAEAIAPMLGNLLIRSAILLDDNDKRIGEVIGIDLESNFVLAEPFVISKRVERKRVFDGDLVFGKRINSKGDEIFIVQATDGDVDMKTRAALQKAKRNVINAFVPGDIREEVAEKCKAVVESDVKADPKAHIKRLADGFAAIGVLPDQLDDYLGHPMDACTPDEILELKGLYSGMRDGETNWQEIMEHGRKVKEQKPLTEDEKKLRVEGIQFAAKVKVERPAAHTAALKAIGLPETSRPDAMSFALLQRFVAAIRAEIEKAEKPQTTSGTAPTTTPAADAKKSQETPKKESK